MADETHTIRDAEGNLHTVVLRRDARLKKSARWARERDGTIVLRVPIRMPKSHLKSLLDSVAKSIEKQEKARNRRAARSDTELQARASQINKLYFGGKIQWAAIRWVDNMEKRLGSCTNGGVTDGHI